MRVVGYNKDFGFGFYCTRLERQAQRWAISKRNPHIVCAYEYTPDDSLIVKCFENMTDEWLDFVASCRHGDSHNYDIVEGPIRYYFPLTGRFIRSSSFHPINYEQQVFPG